MTPPYLPPENRLIQNKEIHELEKKRNFMNKFLQVDLIKIIFEIKYILKDEEKKNRKESSKITENNMAWDNDF